MQNHFLMKRIRHGHGDVCSSINSSFSLQREMKYHNWIMFLIFSAFHKVHIKGVASAFFSFAFIHNFSVHMNDKHNSTWHRQIALYSLLFSPFFNLCHADNEFCFNLFR